MSRSLFARVRAVLGLTRDVSLGVRPPMVASRAELRDLASALATGARPRIDDQTWKDLDLDALFDRIAARLSLTGQLFLHHRLRAGGSPEDLDRFQRVLERPQDVTAMLGLYAGMRRADVNIGQPLFVSGFPAPPALGRWTWLPIPLLVSSLALAQLTPLGWFGLVGALLFTGFISIRLYLPMKLWHQQRDVLLQALATARALHRQLPAPLLARAGLPPREALDTAASMLQPTLWGRSAGVAEYANLLFLTQYAEMVRQLKAMPAHLPALRQLVRSISELEADLAVLDDARAHQLALCTVDPAPDDTVALEGLRNPLLPSGAPVAVALGGEGLLLTGKNGAGKSTLLRTIALSVVMYRSFGVACASKARLSCRFVMSSMRIDDSLALGDSSHVAEAKRIRDMLAHAATQPGSLLVVDEVFHATNPIESVAAAVPALAQLALDGVVLVSTHHLILAPLLHRHLRPMKLELEPGGARRVSDGVLGETNGIDVLETVGIDPALVAQSRALAARLEALMKNPPPSQLPAIDAPSRATPASPHEAKPNAACAAAVLSSGITDTPIGRPT